MTESVEIVEARARLAQYKAAEEKILLGQSYSIGNRSLVRADLKEVLSEIRRLEQIINSATASIKLQRVYPID